MGATGTSQIFDSGIALSAGTGLQQLYIDLTSWSGGDELLAPGAVSLRQASPQPGTGISSASAIGGSGGGGNFSFPEANGYASPMVEAYVDSCVASGGNVSITSVASPNVTSYADNAGGGFVSIGQSQSYTTTNITNLAFVGAPPDGNTGNDANISTTGNVPGGNNFVLSSTTSSTSNASGDAKGGGVVANIGSTTSDTVNDTTTSTVGANAIISARTVNVSAQVSSINASTNAYAIGGGLFGDSNAEANTKVGNSTVEAHLAGAVGTNTQITGTQGVDVTASQNNIQLTRTRTAIFIGIGPSVPLGSTGGTLYDHGPGRPGRHGQRRSAGTRRPGPATDPADGSY